MLSEGPRGGSADWEVGDSAVRTGVGAGISSPRGLQEAVKLSPSGCLSGEEEEAAGNGTKAK